MPKKREAPIKRCGKALCKAGGAIPQGGVKSAARPRVAATCQACMSCWPRLGARSKLTPTFPSSLCHATANGTSYPSSSSSASWAREWGTGKGGAACTCAPCLHNPCLAPMRAMMARHHRSQSRLMPVGPSSSSPIPPTNTHARHSSGYYFYVRFHAIIVNGWPPYQTFIIMLELVGMSSFLPYAILVRGTWGCGCCCSQGCLGWSGGGGFQEWGNGFFPWGSCGRQPLHMGMCGFMQGARAGVEDGRKEWGQGWRRDGHQPASFTELWADASQEHRPAGAPRAATTMHHPLVNLVTLMLNTSCTPPCP